MKAADFLRQRLECIEKFDARVLMPPDNMPTNVPGEAIIYPHRIDIRNVDNSINSPQIFYFSYYLNERHRGEIPNTQTRAATMDGSIALQRRYFVEIWRKVNYKLQGRSSDFPNNPDEAIKSLEKKTEEFVNAIGHYGMIQTEFDESEEGKQASFLKRIIVVDLPPIVDAESKEKMEGSP